MYEAIVIGGGPVGSRVAFSLAEKGRRVLVLERKLRPGQKSVCTGIVGRECAAAFAIGDEVILRKINSASLFSPAGNRLYVHREEIQACVLDRAAFDAMMAERAQAAGAEYRFDSRVTGVEIQPDGAAITVSHHGREQRISSQTVVVACGFAPGFLRRLGLGTFRDFAFGAQAEVRTIGADEVEVYFGDIAPRFFAWLVPTVPGIARAGLLSRKKPGPYLTNWLKRLQSRGRITTADVKISHGAVPLKPLPRTYGERMLVVGDAAGQVKPTSGGGIYYGLLCADIAAATIQRALADGDLSSKSLSMYEKGWRDKLGRELRTGYWARQLYERLNNRQIDRLFEIVSAGGIDEAILNARDISFDWHSRTVRQLLKYQIVTGALKITRLPLNLR